MAWYHDEANKQNAIDRESAHKRQLIQQSNFWANLRRQIEADVAGINDTELWKKRLAGFPITVANISTGDGYAINKPGHPYVFIAVRHMGDHVALVRDFANQRGLEQYESDEDLLIGATGEQVCLQTQSNARLIVPEEAAKYILMPIIESLKNTNPSD